MDNNGIDALLVALKRKEAGGPDDMSIDMPDSANDDEGSEDTNAKIVEALQTEYPQIYAKLAKEVGGNSDDTSDSQTLDDVMQ